MPEPQTLLPPEQIYRIGRNGSPLHYSCIKPEDAQLAKAGNRFDVAGGGVLYAASQRAACYGETLSRLRPTPAAFDLDEEDPKYMRVGEVPRDWRTRRSMATLRLVDPLPFLNVDDPESQAFLSEELGPTLLSLGYRDNIDLSTLRNQDRRLSRAISLLAYSSLDENGFYRYGGIAYASRVSDDWQNWAIFDGNEVVVDSQDAIVLSDPDLRTIAAMWRLTVR